MKKFLWYSVLSFFISIVLIGCSSEEKDKKVALSKKSTEQEEVNVAELPPVDSIVFEGLVLNVDSLVKNFIQAVEVRNLEGIQKHLVSTREHKELYYHTPGADLNPQSAGFISGLFRMSNGKHLGRWLDAFEARGYKYLRHEIGPVKKEGKGFQILSNCKLWVTNKEGAVEEIELFRSVLKLETESGVLRGYKIWSILDD